MPVKRAVCGCWLLVLVVIDRSLLSFVVCGLLVVAVLIVARSVLLLDVIFVG